MLSFDLVWRWEEGSWEAGWRVTGSGQALGCPPLHRVGNGDYHHHQAHTLTPRGSATELAKGVTWGVVENRKGGKGKGPHSHHLS